MRIVWLLLLGCGAAEDPQLLSYQQAIAEFDNGERAMEAGDYSAALVAFERAQAIRPSDAILGAWRAKALADSGDLEGAIAALGTVVAARPNFSEARYNRAAYLARLRRFDEAAADIRKLFEAKAYTAQDLYDDPDFRAALGEAPFAFVPKATVQGDLILPEHRVVYGTDVPVRLELRGTTRLANLQLTGSATGPVRLTRGLEEPVEEGVNLTWTLRVVGPGSVTVGPFWVEASGAERHQVVAKAFETWSPPNRKVEKSRTVALAAPSQLVGERQPPAAWREQSSVFVLTPEGHKVETTPPLSTDAVVHERRQKGVADWVLLEYAHVEDGKRGIRVSHRGQSVLEREL